MLSLITRKNSRHPLLLVGLVALGVAVPVVAHHAADGRRARADRVAGVGHRREHADASAAPDALAGSGIYLGLAASAVLVLFGLTIVIKRASTPYVVAEPDDDV